MESTGHLHLFLMFLLLQGELEVLEVLIEIQLEFSRYCSTVSRSSMKVQVKYDCFLVHLVWISNDPDLQSTVSLPRFLLTCNWSFTHA